MINPKKMALLELRKQMNKKRFQDKPIDPKDEMTKAMDAQEGSPEEEEDESPAEESKEDKAGEGDEFDKYRKGFMKGSKPKSAPGATLAIMIGQKPPGGMPPMPGRKGRGKRG